MLSGKLLRQILDKMLKNSSVAQNARVQIVDKTGKFYDVSEIRLAENKLVGGQRNSQNYTNFSRGKRVENG